MNKLIIRVYSCSFTMLMCIISCFTSFCSCAPCELLTPQPTCQVQCPCRFKPSLSRIIILSVPRSYRNSTGATMVVDDETYGES